MSRKNKKTYQVKDKPKRLIEISGRVGLLYVDAEQLAKPALGDFFVFPKAEDMHVDDPEVYEYLGFTGYFKVDVWDGRDWRPVILSEIFPGREHYFSKREMPLACYYICRDMLQALQGRQLVRTYREHYDLVDDEEIPDDNEA